MDVAANLLKPPDFWGTFSKPRRVNSKPVLHRPVEPAPYCGNFAFSVHAKPCWQQLRTSPRLNGRAIQRLSGSDSHDFAVSQCFDIAHWWLAKETPVLAIELARAFVANLERCTCRIHFPREHPLPRGMKAKPLLKLQRGHRGKGAKMMVKRRPSGACARLVEIA